MFGFENLTWQMSNPRPSTPWYLHAANRRRHEAERAGDVWCIPYHGPLCTVKDQKKTLREEDCTKMDKHFLKCSCLQIMNVASAHVKLFRGFVCGT